MYPAGFPAGSAVKNPPIIQELQETWVRSLGREDPLDAGTATHSSILAWRIPWTEEPKQATVHRVAKNPTRLKLLIMAWPRTLQVLSILNSVPCNPQKS